jgi:hypothetical protein
MAELSDDLAAYQAVRADLESEHLGKWVLVHNKNVQGVFASAIFYCSSGDGTARQGWQR